MDTLARSFNYSVSIGFLFLIILMIGLAVNGFIELNIINSNLETIVEVHNKKTEIVTDMEVAGNRRSDSLYNMMLLDDPFERDQKYLEFNKYGFYFGLARNRLRSLGANDQEKILYDRQGVIIGEVEEKQEAVINLLILDKTKQARIFHTEQVVPIQQAVNSTINKIRNIQKSQTDKAVKIARDAYEFYLWLSIAFAILAIALAIIIARVVLERIRVQAEKIQLSLKKNDSLIFQLERKNKQAEDAVKSKTRFLAAASHDLRQPLHAMGLFLSTLKEHKLNKEALKILDDINLTKEVLTDLLNALLDLSKLDAGQQIVRTDHFKINQLLTDIYNEFKEQANQKKLEFRFVSPDTSVNSDSVLLGSLIRNLVSNAIKYTESGKVLLACRKKGKHLSIYVADTGIGIPKNELDNVFIEFKQLNNSVRDRSKGLGLGLTIVKRTANLLDYPLSLKSEINKGTCFIVDVPISKKTSLKERHKSSPNTLNYDIHNMKIIAIDNEEAIRYSLTGLLRSWGCWVIDGDSYENVIDKLNQQKSFGAPDLIISDYHLQEDCNGISAINRLRALFTNKIPALLITGDTQQERQAEAQKNNCDLLHKPISGAKLRRVITLQKHQSCHIYD